MLEKPKNLHKEPREHLIWWLPLGLIFVLGLGLRVIGLNHLPLWADWDAQNYHRWALPILETGRANTDGGLDGTGYPPGFLYLLAIEKVALDTFVGDEITPAQDYFLVGRVVNGFIGALCIVLLA